MLKVLRAVGETAESASRRRLEPLRKVFICEVLRCNFGRRDCGGEVGGPRRGGCEGNMASEAVMLPVSRCS